MKTDVIKQVIGLVDYNKMINPSAHPAQGQFVVTGTTSGDDSKRLGYCVQVRKRRGQFGSDMVFLRHYDGSLCTHENQFYFAMTDEQLGLARSIFTFQPEAEDYSLGFRCCRKILEVGFVIENSASEPMPDSPFLITVMSKEAK
ncbi:TPA: plasmid protein [Serratia odorifera]|nr:plasmid protein [Serratia odorifera]